ncbi:hypothetical protein BHE74_00015827 [Ensete ventricosum]|nr:hypothetical protein BHE74_00015827 [Ensete ventricosum]
MTYAGELAKDSEDDLSFHPSLVQPDVSSLPEMDVVTPVTTVPVINPSTTPTTTTPVYNPFTTPPTPPMTPATNPYSTPSMVTPSSPSSGQSWCVASQTASQTALQVALDYACGYGGADCSTIQQGGSCFDPDTVRDHASYAFNDYYQKNPIPTSCDFGGTAAIINVDPSKGKPRSCLDMSVFVPLYHGLSICGSMILHPIPDHLKSAFDPAYLEPGPLRGCKPVSSQEDPEEDGILAKGSGSLSNKIVLLEALVNGLQEEPYAHDVHLPIASPMMGLVEEVEGCRLFTPRRSTPSKEP